MNGYVLGEIIVPLIVALLVGVVIGWLLWGFRRKKVTYSEWETVTEPAPTGDGDDTRIVIDLRRELETAGSRIEELESELAVVGAPGSSGFVSAGSAAGVGLDEPYGDGSLAPLADGSAPVGYPIKGNVDSMLYHRPDSRNYGATVAEVWFDTSDRAEVAGFSLAATHPKAGGATLIDPALHPYGEGSLAPSSDGSSPAGYPIKGNVDSMLYHRPDSRNYGATVAEVWFDTSERAEAAGFGLAATHPNG